MGIKVHVIFYSMYGHVYRMAEAVLAGVKEVAGAEASLFQVAELVPDAILEKSGAKGARAAFAHVPIATMDSLANGLACGAASGDFWDAYEVWKHGCTDAEFSRSDRRVVGQGHADR